MDFVFKFTDNKGTGFTFVLYKLISDPDCIRISVRFIDAWQKGSMTAYYKKDKLDCPANFDGILSEEAEKFLYRILKMKAFL